MAETKDSSRIGDILDLMPGDNDDVDVTVQELERLFPGAASVRDITREQALQIGATPWEAKKLSIGAALGFAVGRRLLEPVDD